MKALSRVRVAAALLVVFGSAAQAADAPPPPPAVAPAPASSPAPAEAPSTKDARRSRWSSAPSSTTAGAVIEELRVRGQLVKATVHPKDGSPRYEIIVGDGSRELSTEGRNNSRGATGKRVWNVLTF